MLKPIQMADAKGFSLRLQASEPVFPSTAWEGPTASTVHECRLKGEAIDLDAMMRQHHNVKTETGARVAGR